MQHQWSPEEISNRLKLENNSIVISYSTIYRGIYNGLLEEGLLSHGQRGIARKLRHRGKTRRAKGYIEKRGKIRISHPIEERPEVANNRKRIGDWEADTVAGQTGKACLVTLTDRNSRFLLCEKAAKKESQAVSDKMISMLSGQPIQTITPDHGKEFAQHANITMALGGIPFYFPALHHPWQRGTNENTNGLLREYFPKNADLTDVSDRIIQEKVLELNKRPRKCLNWKTPYEMYYEKLFT
ncbi:IS30 family transposase [Aminipila sp.]|uniref:IS30 family transposase n=1 Tax=Aminipila sp. TaxID=2060095 RepID=UPI0028988B21|nr:IS30 family transposase [Aminipila sp.]